MKFFFWVRKAYKNFLRELNRSVRHFILENVKVTFLEVGTYQKLKDPHSQLP